MPGRSATDVLWTLAPGLRDLRGAGREQLRRDGIAAITIAAVAIPSSLGYAELAGLPVVAGLYASMVPLLGYALAGSSRQLIVGAEGTLAALTAITVAPLANGDPVRYAALAALLALMTGAILLVGGVLQCGFLADFFSRPVLLGYINGTALTIIAGQLGKLLGVSVDASDFFPILKEVASELGEAHGATVLLSAALLALLLGLRRIAPVVPAALVVVALATVASAAFDLEGRGIAVVGDVEGGAPPLGLPSFSVGDLLDLLLPAAAFALMAFADTIATARNFAAKNRYDIDPNRELAGLGAANVGAGLTGAFPVSCSGSRTAVADGNGAGSQIAGIATALIVAVVALFATPLIEPLPKCALAVVVIVAAYGLIEIGSVWRMRLVRPAEVGLAAAASLGVLLLGVLSGVVLAIGLSIGVFIYRAARPNDAVLGHVDDIDSWKDVEHWGDAATRTDIVVYRFDAPLFFVNAEHFRARVRELARSSGGELRWVVLVADTWGYVDATSIAALRQIRRDLAALGVGVAVARPKQRLREILADTGVAEEIGQDRIFPTVRAAVEALTDAAPPAADAPA